jgi:hypothetical protein
MQHEAFRPFAELRQQCLVDAQDARDRGDRDRHRDFGNEVELGAAGKPVERLIDNLFNDRARILVSRLPIGAEEIVAVNRRLVAQALKARMGIGAKFRVDLGEGDAARKRLGHDAV